MKHKITALKLQKRNQQRVNVYLDGEFAFGLAKIVAAWLQVGDEISAEKIAQLQEEDNLEVAYQRALTALNYRPRSEREVRQHLKKKGFAEDVIDAVIQRLQNNQFIDDDRFAELWIENRSESRPRGKRALAYELRQRGIDTDIIERSLLDVDEETLAHQAAQKQARKLKTLEWVDFRKKMYGYLSRRGFSYEISAPIVAQVWAEIQGEEHDQRASE